MQYDARRAEILGSIDYVILSKGKHTFYDLRYDPLRRGKSDRFRAAVLRARSGKASSVYGYRLVPIKAARKTSRQLLVLKVEKS